MLVYGGSGVDPSKGIDRALNDIWCYDVSRETFNVNIQDKNICNIRVEELTEKFNNSISDHF